MPQEDTAVMDRRAAIEAAFKEDDKEPVATPAPAVSEAPAPSPAASEPAAPAAASAPAADEAKPPAPTPSPAPTEGEVKDEVNADKAPQSWRAPQKAKWAALDPDVRQEIVRRERETTRVLGETAQARQLASAFHQAVQPFAAHLQAREAHPIAAFQELLKADYILTTAPKQQRAAFMAKLIKDYDIDVHALDSALAGVAPSDPVESKVEQLLQQRLAPFQQFITQQQQSAEAQRAAEAEKSKQTIESMESDPKYPYFSDVREDMADLIEIAAKRGVYLSLDQAYTRAIAMNPEVSKQVQASQESEAAKAAAKAAHERAQRAKGASVSVGGAPNGAPSSVPPATDRLATIRAAFETLGGR